MKSKSPLPATTAGSGAPSPTLRVGSAPPPKRERRRGQSGASRRRERRILFLSILLLISNLYCYFSCISLSDSLQVNSLVSEVELVEINGVRRLIVVSVHLVVDGDAVPAGG